MMHAINQFREAIMSAGLQPPDVIVPGRLHRFPGAGKRNNNRAGWCRLFSDGCGGCFGDWSTGLSELWQARREYRFARGERAAALRCAIEARAEAEQQQKSLHDDAAKRAARIWYSLPPAPPDHPYLLKKRVTAGEARFREGVLVLPVLSSDGQLRSLQFINPYGRKRLLAGGQKRGCHIPVAWGVADPRRVIVCEGWATGRSLAEDDPSALVIAAIDAGNLESVAISTRFQFPAAEIVIAGDDDRMTAGNPGATKARAAAVAAGALLALPQWPADAPKSLTDFNDLANWLERGR